jgi:hypothetical protein
MSGFNIENIERDIELSKTFLTRISEFHPNIIKEFFESIYEMYKHHFSEPLLAQDYETNRIFSIQYDKDGYVRSASLKWNYYDRAEIRLKYSGLEVVFTPEHGSDKQIAELHWKILNPYLESFLNK